jgi:hypothetical protein
VQTTLVLALRQAPAPSQVPSLPHFLVVVSSLQKLWAFLPLMTGAQVPEGWPVSACAQALQPMQSLSQQTASAQMPEAQALPTEHGDPRVNSDGASEGAGRTSEAASGPPLLPPAPPAASIPGVLGAASGPVDPVEPATPPGPSVPAGAAPSKPPSAASAVPWLSTTTTPSLPPSGSIQRQSSVQMYPVLHGALGEQKSQFRFTQASPSVTGRRSASTIEYTARWFLMVQLSVGG